MCEPSHAATLPALVDSIIPGDQLHLLFDDVATCTQVLAVLVRASGHIRGAAPAELPLMDSMSALLGGTARSVQLRYQWQGSEWWDTISAAEGGFRLVRIRHEAA